MLLLTESCRMSRLDRWRRLGAFGAAGERILHTPASIATGCVSLAKEEHESRHQANIVHLTHWRISTLRFFRSETLCRSSGTSDSIPMSLVLHFLLTISVHREKAASLSKNHGYLVVGCHAAVKKRIRLRKRCFEERAYTDALLSNWAITCKNGWTSSRSEV